MKFLLSIIAGMLMLAFFFIWIAPPADWVQIETTHSYQTKKSVRMAGATLQITHIKKNDAGEETVIISYSISGPK
ncbi:hypothetical protein MOB09_13175 [Bacillus vallismortis]|uniref:hypothetical protein n=1 Tax=Bacillus vallismortis TaxID=72361 RepID=UPI002282BF74|nr:hypothetical protein [Bacillus vallismortis]MCY7893943.1 hypothetical protein [Bacillus vallismortis]